MRLGKLRDKTFPVVIDFGDNDLVKLSMRPHVDGQAEAKQLKQKIDASEDDQETIDLIQEKFCRTITQWDMQDDDGNDIPLTVAGLTAANVPISILGDLLVRGYDEVANTKKLGGRR